jgi:hypothetical protein
MGGTIDDDISVERDAARLLAFTWNDQRYPVSAYQVVGTPPTRWWEDQGERTYVRATAQGCLYELYFDHERRTWVLARRLS